MRLLLVSSTLMMMMAVWAETADGWGMSCRNPAYRLGGWVGINQECAALVQTACNAGSTYNWSPGQHVASNCNNISPMTAIATFLGPGGRYDDPYLRQHTAIFLRCERNGIRVFDQWNGYPLARRLIPWRGYSAQYSGNNYYTVR